MHFFQIICSGFYTSKLNGQIIQLMNKFLKVLQYCLSPVLNVRRTIVGFSQYPHYFVDWMRYRYLWGSDQAPLIDIHPCLFDRTVATSFDSHYTYLNAWAFRRILGENPDKHIDIGSQVSFIATLSSILPVTFIDLRPIDINLSGLTAQKGSILKIPYSDQEIVSLSSLHVIEHVGLGRYGDPLDMEGSQKAIAELSRVLAPGGKLYIGVPVGKPKTCFNAHRVFDPVKVIHWFAEYGLTMENFSCVFDNGDYSENTSPSELMEADYACGMYQFTRMI
jgi:SAM-dependent methyltransferase